MQEEIRFAVCPETLVTLLVNERMADRDAIVIRGAEQFAQYAVRLFSLSHHPGGLTRAPRRRVTVVR